MLRDARERERSAEKVRLHAARTRQLGRVRAVWLELRCELARRGLVSLEKELQRLWREDPLARRCWLERGLSEAARVLPGKHWILQHPCDIGPENLDRVVSS